MRFREDQESPDREPDGMGWLHGKLGRRTSAGEKAAATYLGADVSILGASRAGAVPPKSPQDVGMLMSLCPL